jgi:hypothetical protein
MPVGGYPPPRGPPSLRIARWFSGVLSSCASHARSRFGVWLPSLCIARSCRSAVSPPPPGIGTLRRPRCVVLFRLSQGRRVQGPYTCLRWVLFVGVCVVCLSRVCVFPLCFVLCLFVCSGVVCLFLFHAVVSFVCVCVFVCMFLCFRASPAPWPALPAPCAAEGFSGEPYCLVWAVSGVCHFLVTSVGFSFV